MPQPIREEKVGPQWLDRCSQHALVRKVEQSKNQRDITIIQLLLNTGLRVSELCSLMWSDIKITSRKGQLTVRSGKRGKRREIPLNKDARAKRDLKEFHLAVAKSTNQKVRLLKELGQVLLDKGVENEQVRSEIFQKITPEALQAAIEDCKRLMRPDDDNHFDFLANRYGYVRRFAPVFFLMFSFSSNLNNDPLLQAIDLLRKLDAETRA